MRSMRMIGYDEAMRCIALLDKLDRFGFIKFKMPYNPFREVTNEMRIAVRKLWQHDSQFIEQFLVSNQQLSFDDADIIRRWDQKVSGEFLILKYYREYAVFLCMETSKYYAVKALTDDFTIVLSCRDPLMVEATLYPYKEHIIWDGIVMLSNIVFGKSMSTSFAESADMAQANGKIIQQISSCRKKFLNIKPNEGLCQKR